ncbi:MAG TPA: outer membrane lipoprotein carrier protein LolA [Roseomonas sp.]|jgi:outer membrane lipoprotein-sorting protein
MHRRALIALAAALPAVPALAQSPRGRPPRQEPPPLGGAELPEPERGQVLARVETYLNALRSLKARFLQTAQNGQTAQGTAWIARPGRMRFDYDPPVPLLLVASYGQFILYDRELRSPSTVPTSATPLGMLLQENFRFANAITVTSVMREGGLLRVTLFRSSQPNEGRLTLVLQESPMELRQWVVLDAQGRQTRVTLSSIEFGGRFDDRIFAFNNPTFFEPGGFGEPQR